MPHSPTRLVEMVVTVADSHRESLSGLVQQLQARGLTDATALEAAGLITGHAPIEVLKDLQDVLGVRAVETSGMTQLPPPDSKIQ
ncbi:hypothetical protein [Pelomonas cellulosilytica]|uniref:Ketohydroxyglutarate aldolase n=1 Tax=Pelomonas cellulosilytica TaxID=2906762 RepID=A0ABS8XW48_9BURK|nr:hypothetical protein [Pelomonas sp. P8]MCE4555935.1 hypothetical protein [Pelomonas sp. P8]